jgi:hypothetical protein
MHVFVAAAIEAMPPYGYLLYLHSGWNFDVSLGV